MTRHGGTGLSPGVSQPVADTLAASAPVVALESPLVAHGLPRPLDPETAHDQPPPAAVQSSTWRLRPPARSMPLQWSWSSALVLLALLACAGVTVHAQSGPSTSDPLVEAVQRKLAERGYDPGTIDGLMGWRTRDAISKFQRSAGLLDTGKIDDASLAALGLDPPGSAPVEAEGGTSKAEASNARPVTEAGAAPGTGASGTEAPRTEPAPGRPARRELSFTTLGWHRPQTGAEALARFDALGLPRDFRREAGPLFVPKAELVFVLRAGERVPGLDCDPGAGRLAVEFVFEPDGPVVFTPVPDGEYCQMGIGIAIEVGHSLEMRRIDWGDVQYPRGTVRITNQGLEYVR